MVFIEGIFALTVALFLTVVFAVIGRQAKSARRVVIFFLVVFFGSWVGGIWVTPVGPSVFGAYWLTFFAAGLIFALVLEVLAASRFLPPASPERVVQTEKREEREIEFVIGGFFWFLLIVFIAAIVFGYLRRAR
jgi:zinc transporter ZupT